MNRVPESVISRETNPFGWPHSPADTSDSTRQPHMALGEAVADSVMPYIHPEDNAPGDNLKRALLSQFSHENPDTTFHQSSLRVLCDLGFVINPVAAESGDLINNQLLILPPQKTADFRKRFPEDFRFMNGGDLVDYLFDLDVELNRYREGDDISNFFDWNRRLIAVVYPKPEPDLTKEDQAEKINL